MKTRKLKHKEIKVLLDDYYKNINTPSLKEFYDNVIGFFKDYTKDFNGQFLIDTNNEIYFKSDVAEREGFYTLDKLNNSVNLKY